MQVTSVQKHLVRNATVKSSVRTLHCNSVRKTMKDRALTMEKAVVALIVLARAVPVVSILCQMLQICSASEKS